MLALDPRRLRLAAAVGRGRAAPAAAVWLASASPGLTRMGSTLDEASEDGRRLALVLPLLGLVAAALSARVRDARIDRLASRAEPTAWEDSQLWSLACGAPDRRVRRYGNPVAIAERAYDEFRAPPPELEGDLNARLFNLSSPGARAAVEGRLADGREHPGLGAGAGTYERYWHRDRPVAGKVRDAHSLYLETLAELGPVGLALLLLALGVPLVVAVKARHHRLVPVAFGAYVAYLAHAAVDWDWEMPAVTLTALLAGAAILVAAREERVLILSPVLRGALLLAISAAGRLRFRRADREQRPRRERGRLESADGDRGGAQGDSLGALVRERDRAARRGAVRVRVAEGGAAELPESAREESGRLGLVVRRCDRQRRQATAPGGRARFAAQPTR